MSFKYEIRLALGCYSGPESPLISRHKTLAAAVKAARKSDRLQVELNGKRIYKPLSKRPELVGNKDTRPLAIAMEMAQQAEASL